MCKPYTLRHGTSSFTPGDTVVVGDGNVYHTVQVQEVEGVRVSRVDEQGHPYFVWEVTIRGRTVVEGEHDG